MTYVLYLDDYHAADVHFLQSLARGLSRMHANPSPLLVHGSGEHAERILEANGIFRRRKCGVLPVQSLEEHQLVERAARQLNQKIVAILSDAVVPSVGVFGTSRKTLIVRGEDLTASGASWIRGMMAQGIIPVLASFARMEGTGTSGEVPIAQAIAALAKSFAPDSAQVVFFTKTNLPGLMQGGSPIENVSRTHTGLPAAAPDLPGLERVLDAGLSVLLTNTTRFADERGPIGTHVTPLAG